MDFKPKLIRRDRERHCILIRGKIHPEDIAILNIYASEFITVETVLQLNPHINPHIVIVMDFNSPTLPNR